MSAKKISVIIPTIGRDTLSSALESCFSQSIKFHEIVVVDDSLKQDVGVEVRGANATTVRVLRTGGLKGANFSRNQGLYGITSAFVTFLDDDDIFLPWRNAMLDEQAEGRGIFTHKSLIFNEDSGGFSLGKQPTGEFSWSRLLWGNTLGASPLVSTDIIQQCGGFDESLGSSQDWDMWLRVSKEVGTFRIYECYSHISKVSTTRDRISNSLSKRQNKLIVVGKHRENSSLVNKAYWQIRRVINR